MKDIIKGSILCISILGLSGYSMFHNWNLTMPERWADPFNWIVTAIFIVLFLIGKFILKIL